MNGLDTLRLEKWRRLSKRLAEHESFKQNVLRELQQKKEEWKGKIRDLRVQGDHHKANRAEANLQFLEKVVKSMDRLPEA